MLSTYRNVLPTLVNSYEQCLLINYVSNCANRTQSRHLYIVTKWNEKKKVKINRNFKWKIQFERVENCAKCLCGKWKNQNNFQIQKYFLQEIFFVIEIMKNIKITWNKQKRVFECGFLNNNLCKTGMKRENLQIQKIFWNHDIKATYLVVIFNAFF